MEDVYRADRTDIPLYKAGVERGASQPVGLVIELSSTNVYPVGTLVADGFCGERLRIAMLGDGRLYRASKNGGRGGPTEPEGELKLARHRYFVVADIKSKPILTSPEWSKFNLETDRRDVCIHTLFGNPYEGWYSNEVRVPRALIEQALHDPDRPDIPSPP